MIIFYILCPNSIPIFTSKMSFPIIACLYLIPFMAMIIMAFPTTIQTLRPDVKRIKQPIISTLV